ncbi:hypothetical protein [Tuberibacillus sp. Marseille-P3662]|uniref:hypothetical protein n=1 Tax=Tuberibacillus sp. Marseille-P3662 TaxID=1965358 RepID=UPI000A1CBF64|nr:hypothetical protein [Tuberibacillus sp. Marseille-P3662]
MQQKRSKQRNEIIGSIVSIIIIIGFLCLDLYNFFNKDSIVAKSLAAGSFIVFMFLFILFLKSVLNQKGPEG